MNKCKLCGYNKTLIKAHIIPRKLYKPIREAFNNETPSNKVPCIYEAESKSQQCQSGIYDQFILCSDCDNEIIGQWDTYGQNLLLNSPDLKNYLNDYTGKDKICKIESFDYKKLKLFFLSILWRSAITSNPFFAQIKLGCWEGKLKTMIKNEGPGSKHDFSIILFKYEGEFSEVMPNPMKLKLEGINCYRFRFPNYGFLIKVDKRHFSPHLEPYILSPTQPLLIRVKKFTDSQEYKRILETENKFFK